MEWSYIIRESCVSSLCSAFFLQNGSKTWIFLVYRKQVRQFVHISVGKWCALALSRSRVFMIGFEQAKIAAGRMWQRYRRPGAVLNDQTKPRTSRPCHHSILLTYVPPLLWSSTFLLPTINTSQRQSHVNRRPVRIELTACVSVIA